MTMGIFSRIEEVGLLWQESKVRMLPRQVLAKFQGEMKAQP